MTNEPTDDDFLPAFKLTRDRKWVQTAEQHRDRREHRQARNRVMRRQKAGFNNERRNA